MPSEPPILSPKEAAARYRVSERTIVRLIANGTIPAIKIGRLWRIRTADLDRVFSTERLTPPAEPTHPPPRRPTPRRPSKPK